MRPLNYISGGSVLGHYSVGQRSGEIAATLGAAGHLARIRWAPTTAGTFLALMKLRVGVTVSAAVTTATEFAFRAIVVRGFSVDFATSTMTQISMAGVTNTNKMRATMGSSLMGTSGPGICTTSVLVTSTMTADAAPFAIASLPSPSTTLGASAVTIQVGAGTPMHTLYEWNDLGQHPLLLSANEGVVVQNVLAGPGTGTFALYCEWTWAEVFAF